MKKKKKGLGFLPFVIFAVGIGILLYPTASNYYNVVHQSNAIVEYADSLSAMDNEAIQRMWAEAVAYNDNLYRAQLWEELPEDALSNYDNILRVSDNGMMGYIDIPKISVHLPIYHGTSEPALQKGIGHLEWSSFPVGGTNTHTVLTGHTGLPSSRLFTDLEKLEPGDTFVLQIAGEPLYYEVESILTVLPYELDNLAIWGGEDLCTLVTCTPYGVNSHRRLVQAHRIIDPEQYGLEPVSLEAAAENNALLPMEEMLLVVGICVGLLLHILLWTTGKKKTAQVPSEEEKPKDEGQA